MCRCRLLNSAFSGIFFFSSSFLLSSLSVDDVYSAFSGIFYFFAERPIFFSGGEGLVINEEEERENEERCSMLLANLGMKPGDVICDMGCGNGFYALQMAQLIGDEIEISPAQLGLPLIAG